MLTFKQYLIEQKNLHMDHIEDLIFLEGINGTRKAILFLRDLRDMLGGNSKRSLALTTKWDGSPAIYCGIDPEDNKFFVAKKGLFAKTPKMYKTQEDIDRELSGDLNEKFSIALKEFAKLGIKSGVYQGDLMFTKGDLKSETIENEKYITFQPNTIVYAVPQNSNLAKQILNSRIGVIWHTTYSGNSIQDMKASFGGNITSKLKNVPSVWMDDATYKNYSGSATFTENETKKFDRLLSNIGKNFRIMNGDAFKTITSNPELKQKSLTFFNTYIRQGKSFSPGRIMVSDFIEYIENWYNKEIEKKKSEKGKETWKKKKSEFIQSVMKNRNQISAMFDLMQMMAEAKQMIVNKLNTVSSIDTFLRTKSGFRVTNQEGFVAIDQLGTNAVKLVDRFEFSRANFSSEIIKGWER